MLRRYLFASILCILFALSFCFTYSSKNFTTNRSIFSFFSSTRQIEEEDLLGRVEIPKIKVSENIYSMDSSKNQVDQHVSILKGSILPYQDSNSIIFLAAHSGSGKVAYFKDLNQLKLGDFVYFYYQKVQYTYQVTKMFELKKDGDIELTKSSNQQLVLTTCSPTNQDKQLVVDTMLIQKKRI